MELCDLHIHSCCSDGANAPEELIAIAEAAGIRAVALCDHNTVAGLSRFEAAARDSGVIPVAGVEVTTGYEGREVHILGLFLKEEVRPLLAEYLAEINRRKEEVNLALAARLCAGGYSVDYPAICAAAGGAMPNRVHFAKAMMTAGYVNSVAEAFATLLADGGRFYRSAEKLDTVAVVRFLSSLGAVSVLAHPLLNFTPEKLSEFLPKARAAGLCGMETVYSMFKKEESACLAALAAEQHLLPSGGSDFHGENRPGIQMGRGHGELRIPFSFYEGLREAARAVADLPAPIALIDRDLVFRPAYEKDENAVLSLYRGMAGRGFCVWNDEYPTLREIRHDTETGNLYLLCDGREIVGSLSVMPENELDGLPLWEEKGGSPRELARIAVRADHRGRGLAGRMVATISVHLRAAGATSLRLSVAAGNLPALKTYEKEGFSVRGEASLYGGAYCLVEKLLV